jgi:hypothetical protein
MSRTVSLLQLRTDIADQCDFSTSTSGRYTPTLLNRLINQSIQRFRERISATGSTRFLVSATGSIARGTTGTYAFQTLDLSALSPSVVRVYGLDITVGGRVVTLAHRPFAEHNEFITDQTMTGQPIAWAEFQTRSLAILPAPDATYPYTVWYLPVLADLVGDGDTFDGVAGWEVWVMWDCVCQLIARDQYEAAYTQAIAERDLAWADIQRSATRVTQAGGAHLGRDSMGRMGLWGRGKPVPSGQVGSSAQSLLLAATDDGAIPSWDGNIYVPRRLAIIPDYDRTGVVSARSAILAALNSRAGAWVYLGDGMPNIDGTIALPEGSALTGVPQTMILATDPARGKLFTFGFNCQIEDIGIHYPYQSGAYDPRTGNTTADAAPIVYDWTFYIDSKFGAAISNCFVTNPYNMAWVNNTQGAFFDTIRGWPLNRGIMTGLVYDVLRINNVHFNTNVLNSNGAATTLRASVLANGVGFLIDGCDDFKITNSYCGRYQFGIWFHDNDGDGHLSYGDVTDTGIECSTCVVSEAVSFHGIRFKGGSWAPDTGGHGLKCQDSTVPANSFFRPNVELYGIRMGGGTVYHRGVWCTNTSYHVVTMWGGGIINFDQYGFATDGANAIVKYNDAKFSTSLLGGSAINNAGTGISGTTILV